MPEPEAKTIEQLKQQFNELNERKIKTQTQLDEATHQLEKLQAEAVAEFGTCDIDQLQAKLQQMEQENEKRRSEYQTLLDGIAADLTKIETESNASAVGDENEDE